MFESIPHSRPTITSADEAAVVAALRDGYVGPGPLQRELATRFAERAGRRFGRTVLSGTDALREALKLLRLPPGATIAIPVLTCPSVLDACHDLQLRVWLTGLNDDLTLSVDDVGDDVDAVVAPHAWGTPVDAAALASTGRPWVEDAATSPATRTSRGPAGAAGTLSVFSFGPTKYLTGALGGCLVGDVDELAVPSGLPQPMPDLNAALTLSQLGRLDVMRDVRRAIASRYDAAIAGSRAVPRARGPHDCVYRYIARTLAPSGAAVARLRDLGVGASDSVNPWLDTISHEAVIRVPRDGAWRQWRDHLLSVPLYPSLTESEQRRVGEALALL